ncbi:MAG: type II restriction endonuclease [Chloroflexota bacterium]
MKEGYLSNYFEGVAAKRLSVVEVDPDVSNQHEFNGVSQLREMLGKYREEYPATFAYFGEDEAEKIIIPGRVTWYDARENHPTRTEYRLYYTDNEAVTHARSSDLIIIAKVRGRNELFVIIAKAGTIFDNQLMWLFKLPQDLTATQSSFINQPEEVIDSREVEIVARQVLDELGIEIQDDRADNFLEKILDKFGRRFPTTAEFSAFARSTMPEANPIDDPDSALLDWLNREELLFRTLERYLLKEELMNGFVTNGEADVDKFIKFSLSVQNRRKSRAGQALENHLAVIFDEHRINYTRGARTENKSTPDFLFPGIEEYRNSLFPVTQLTMLGVKSSCKDRWRQVLSEAARIDAKHLLTLQAGISEDQTTEMRANKLQLVLPKRIHETYTDAQQEWIVDVSQFISEVARKQTIHHDSASRTSFFIPD